MNLSNKNKKAQGMSLTVIIIAVLALIVLVVLVVIFTGKAGSFGKGTEETSQQFSGSKCEIPGTGGQCIDRTSCENQGRYYRTGEFSDCPGGCCY